MLSQIHNKERQSRVSVACFKWFNADVPSNTDAKYNYLTCDGFLLFVLFYSRCVWHC